MLLGINRFAFLIAGLIVICVGAFAQNPPEPSTKQTAPQQPAPQQAPPKGGATPGDVNGPQSQNEDHQDGGESPLSSMMQPYEYLDLGRKDPFQKPVLEKPLAPGAFHGPVLPLQRFSLDQLQLIGIIWDVAHPRAMLKDPQGKIHMLGPNAKIGNQNGYIAAIREGEVVVIETFEEEGKLRSDVRIVKLSTGKGTATK
jgi:type IV pilus assembly protein PilP